MKSNLSPGLQSAMRKLQRNKDIIISADKGNATTDLSTVHKEDGKPGERWSLWEA